MDRFTVDGAQEGLTVAGMLRAFVAGLSWADARRHLHARRVRVNGVICVDDARRVKAGDIIELHEHSARPLPKPSDITVVYDDDHLLVIEKPPGMSCERRHEERGWSRQKRQRQLTVLESLQKLRGDQVFPVHRLDRDTSGLMIYACTSQARNMLVSAMSAHDVIRVYRAVAIGEVASQTVHSWIVRDRGDGLRGSVDGPREDAQEAFTEFEAQRIIAGKYSVLECRLQTGRTHQIRIHLAEMGHPLCGEKLYLKPTPTAQAIIDDSGAPRHALHSAQLQFTHPITDRPMHLESPWPDDLEAWMRRLGES